jgi:hypothetical protein
VVYYLYYLYCSVPLRAMNLLYYYLSQFAMVSSLLYCRMVEQPLLCVLFLPGIANLVACVMRVGDEDQSADHIRCVSARTRVCNLPDPALDLYRSSAPGRRPRSGRIRLDLPSTILNAAALQRSISSRRLPNCTCSMKAAVLQNIDRTASRSCSGHHSSLL